MKVKGILRFRGKELRTKHIGLQTIEAFLEKIKPWGHCDTKPREAGRSVIVLLNPMSKDQRAPHPNPDERMKERINPAGHRDSRASAPSRGPASTLPAVGLLNPVWRWNPLGRPP